MVQESFISTKCFAVLPKLEMYFPVKGICMSVYDDFSPSLKNMTWLWIHLHGIKLQDRRRLSLSGAGGFRFSGAGYRMQVTRKISSPFRFNEVAIWSVFYSK